MHVFVNENFRMFSIFYDRDSYGPATTPLPEQVFILVFLLSLVSCMKIRSCSSGQAEFPKKMVQRPSPVTLGRKQ